ncbi:MAG TPA: hypothetical protein VGS97_23045 [Actinocrinis sp.]|uniref:hypothetical protein n=1 Tax=Actinocrinis sp. TaxID=1920516 RepID=UPI002DDD426A|nr:hypothetical protein [Actinocrinis sp.]HEV2346997.1 hypothetical protein [Actinocrinis sp.]
MAGVAVIGALSTGRSGWVWDPASADEQLAAACRDLEAGRFGLAREALVATREDFATRARRSMVMASVAAAGEGEAARHWLREAPEDPDAVLLWARTAVVLALRSLRVRDAWTQLAVRACSEAAAAFPADPTPWVALLMLARLGVFPRVTVREGWAAYWARHEPLGPREHPDHLDARWRRRVARGLGGHDQHWPPPSRAAHNRVEVAAEQLGLISARGPWELMLEVWARDPRSREGHHRMLECLSPRCGGSARAMTQFATFVVLAAPDDDPLQLLPLSARVEAYRAAQQDDEAERVVWTEKRVCVNAYFDWFLPLRKGGGPLPVTDCSLLAHALYMAGERTFAGAVIEAMRPYTAPYPWSVTDPQQDGAAGFIEAARALHVPAPRRLSGWERRELSG